MDSGRRASPSDQHKMGQYGHDITSARSPLTARGGDSYAGSRCLALSIRMGHRVDHSGSSEDQDVVLTRRDLDTVGVPDPEPPLGRLGDPLPVPLDGVLMVDNVALDPQV